ncbi:MAG: lytic murein transglycosylase [Melioribacteraceae bacterium]|nr:lytic murein transglycosylase [Melioribacteraceae bacterium]
MKIDRKFNTKYKQSSDSKSSNKMIYIIAGGVAVISIAALLIYFSSGEKEKASPETVNQNPKEIPNEAPKEIPNEAPAMEKPVSYEEINPKYAINNEEMVTSSDKWELSVKFIFDRNGEPRNIYIANFLKQLESFEGEGLPLTREEFKELLSKPGANKIYVKQLIRYATPLSKEIQTKEHEDYAKVFLQEKRILKGIKFMHNYNAILSQAENQYNVPMQDIVSILMWESGLGEYTGNFKVFNVLLEQIVLMDYAQKYAIRKIVNSGKKNPLDDPAKKAKEKDRLDFRRKDAGKNLAALLRESKLKQLDPLKQTGSWGGAIGYVQFMPFNLKYAVDGDGDGTIDLFEFSDAIFSVANYLVEVGNYGTSEKSRRDAIYSYNHNQAYVDGVIAYSDTIWARYSAGE